MNRTEHTFATWAALVAMLGALSVTATPTLAAGPAAPATEAAASLSALPDQRAYELVSPPGEGEPYLPPTPNSNSNGATGFTGALPFRAAADGDAVAWVGEPAISVGTGETGSGEGNEWLSTRRPGEGWTSSDITPTSSREAVFEAFSSDLKTAIVKGASFSPLTSAVPKGCSTLYARGSESGALSALFSMSECGSPLFAGASEDGSQVIFQDVAALTPNALEATEIPPDHNEEGHAAGELGAPCVWGCNLYELVGGQLRLVNVIGGKTVPSATFGGYAPEEGAFTTFSHAISNDGSRIFWTDTQVGPDMEHVYVLEDGTSTVPVSGAGAAEYWTATPDGRYAFYTENGELWRFDTRDNTREVLTPAAYGATGTGDLAGPGSQEITSVATATGHFSVGEHIYGLGIRVGSKIVGVTAGALQLSKPVTAGGTGIALKAGGSEVLGVVGVNETGEDGSYVYFVARGGLAGAGAKTCVPIQEYGTPTTNEAEGCNLYVRHGDVTTFIATLAPQDDDLRASSGGGLVAESSGDWIANIGQRVAQVTPDGRHLVFQSARSLTGYDNNTQSEPAVEVFVYSAQGGTLACASCDPTGAPPVIEEANAQSKLPDSTVNAPTYARRLISEDGNRVFFASAQALAPQDTNGVQDVYEWEREGAGSCASSTPTRADAGCVLLLSGGSSAFNAYLVESDATGENVFFEHFGRLGQVVAPVDHNLLYDARVNGGFTAASQACTGSGCQAVPPPPPAFAAPPSVTFDGPGNFPAPAPSRVAVRSLTRSQRLAKALKACRRSQKKGRRKKSRRASCERQARRRYGAKQIRKATTTSKQAGNERRAQS